MQIIYNQKEDILRILFGKEPIVESDEDRSGVIIDYDKNGKMAGLEILDASKNIENPNSVEYISEKTS